MAKPSSITARRLVFTGEKQAHLETFDPGELGPRSILARTDCSLMSTGTENIVFNRMFDPGTGWDNWVKYPFYPGYASVGTVLEVGSEIKHLKAGDRVAYRVGHRSHAMLREDECFPILGSLEFEQAVWFALAKIAFHGAKAADYQIGDHALIVGAGPIGQMAIRWASALGVEKLIVVDGMASRMALAAAGGASDVIVGNIADVREQVLQAGGGKPPRVVVDSTGNEHVFAETLKLVADFGRVVLLGDTGRPAQQRLSQDVLGRGLTITGAHDGHNTEQWNNATISRYFFRLAQTGRFPLAGLNSHRFLPEQYADAYGIANRDRASTMGIIFDWSK